LFRLHNLGELSKDNSYVDIVQQFWKKYDIEGRMCHERKVEYLIKMLDTTVDE